MIRLIIILSIAGGLLWLPAATVRAAGPQDDIAAANATVERALAAAQSGDFATALTAYKSYENTWYEVEDGVRVASRDAYRAIEKYMSAATLALSAAKPDKTAVVAALTSLDTEQDRFVAGLPPLEARATAASAVGKGDPSVSTLLDLLTASSDAVKAGDYATATIQFSGFVDMWTDVEGEIKTRSSSDYRATENDMARISTALANQSPSAGALLDGMYARLKPYENAGNYRPFDATIIVLREGMEALLVVVALLAFVRKSGNADKSAWIWGGALAGLFASIALGVAIHELLGKALGGENRELMEGITGLVAAAMLLYVSYWLHSKSSLGAWQRYISAQTRRALATGSLVGLALLSFLAVFREGGETVLFLIGMTGKISTGDLLVGLGIGGAFLAVVGLLLTVAGLRIPLRPFFAVASVLTFYLCFKFVGTGIHALQVSDVLSAHAADYLPDNDTLGLFPTWQTTLPQIVLVVIGLAMVARTRLSDRATLRRMAPQEPVTTSD